MEKLYNLEYLNQLADGDEGFKSEMIKYFYKNSPSVLKAMDEFLAEQNWVEIRELMHKYIANLNMIGADRIISTASLIEQFAENKDKLDEIPGLWAEVKSYCQKLLIKLEEDFSQIVN